MIDLKKTRKRFHQIPELAYKEYKTQAYILELLSGYPDLKIHQFEPTGILIEYSKGNGDYSLFRADMDALPITENTGCSFSSQHSGIMHACGHDMHITILLGLIDQIISEGLEENLLFVFQPAEEGQSGAEKILKENIWNKYNIDSVYALHVSPDLPSGSISSRAGNFFAATCEFDIKIKGISSHIATPEKGKNALEAGVEIYQSVRLLPKVVKSNEQFICDFGVLNAGSVRNAIASDCELSGTIRAADRLQIAALKESLQSICDTVSSAYEIDVKLTYLAEYQEVFNSEELVENLKRSADELNIGYKQAEMTMAGEDFGFFTERWEGLLFWLGACGKEYYPLHSDKFLPDENSLELGVKIFYQLITDKTGT